MLISIHEDLARAEGINVKLYNLIYLSTIAIIVSLGVYLVGGLMTAALVAVPAAAAKNVSKTLLQYGLTAVSFGIVSAVIGILLATYLSLPAGPLVILTSGVIFAVTALMTKI